jgi:hypothetical protein
LKRRSSDLTSSGLRIVVVCNLPLYKPQMSSVGRFKQPNFASISVGPAGRNCRTFPARHPMAYQPHLGVVVESNPCASVKPRTRFVLRERPYWPPFPTNATSNHVWLYPAVGQPVIRIPGCKVHELSLPAGLATPLHKHNGSIAQWRTVAQFCCRGP